MLPSYRTKGDGWEGIKRITERIRGAGKGKEEGRKKRKRKEEGEKEEKEENRKKQTEERGIRKKNRGA